MKIKIKKVLLCIMLIIIMCINTPIFADVGSYDRYDSGGSSDWGSSSWSSSDWGSSSSSWDSDWDSDYDGSR